MRSGQNVIQLALRRGRIEYVLEMFKMGINKHLGVDIDYLDPVLESTIAGMVWRSGVDPEALIQLNCNLYKPFEEHPLGLASCLIGSYAQASLVLDQLQKGLWPLSPTKDIIGDYLLRGVRVSHRGLLEFFLQKHFLGGDTLQEILLSPLASDTAQRSCLEVMFSNPGGAPELTIGIFLDRMLAAGIKLHYKFVVLSWQLLTYGIGCFDMLELVFSLLDVTTVNDARVSNPDDFPLPKRFRSYIVTSCDSLALGGVRIDYVTALGRINTLMGALAELVQEPRFFNKKDLLRYFPTVAAHVKKHVPESEWDVESEESFY